MHLVRFLAALTVVVSVSLAGIAFEKSNLAWQRALCLQQYRIDQLLERRALLRTRMTELTSPARSSAEAAHLSHQ